MNPFRVAIVGCGRISHIHAKAYAQSPLAKLVGFADVDSTRAEAYREQYAPGAKAYADYVTMLHELRPDVVSIGLWTKLHLPVVRACGDAGVKAVHCEKPMAPTWGEAKEIMAEAARVRLTFNHQRRFTPSTIAARQILRSGEIGKLERVEAFIPRNLLDWGTHIFDLINCFNHEAPAIWVMGQMDWRKIQIWFGIPFEMQAVVSVRFENGVHAIVHAGEENEWELGFRLHCSDGLIEMKGERELRWLQYGGDWRTQSWPDIELSVEQMKGVIQNNLQTLADGSVPELAAANALRGTEIIFAAYESARRRGRIDLPLEGVEDHPLLSLINANAAGA